MATVVRCDSCGKVVSYKDAMHVRTYKLSSPTTYKTGSVTDVADLCKECYKVLKQMLEKEAMEDAE